MIGTNLAITTKNYSVTGGVTYDADAQAYFTANTAITSDADKNAINTLFLNAKSKGYYTKIKMWNFPIWSSATANKWNLVNPLDTDAAFRFTYTTGWSHTSSGMTGTNANAIPYITPSANLTVNNTHMAVYIGTNTVAGSKVEMGVGVGGTLVPIMMLMSRYTADKAQSNAYNLTTNQLTPTNTDARGLYVSSRVSNVLHKIYKNGNILATDTNTNTNTLPTLGLRIGALNSNGSIVQYTDRQFRFISIGTGLTDTDVTNISNDINTLMTYFGLNTY